MDLIADSQYTCLRHHMLYPIQASNPPNLSSARLLVDLLSADMILQHTFFNFL